MHAHTLAYQMHILNWLNKYRDREKNRERERGNE
jgi:hypothetical protein